MKWVFPTNEAAACVKWPYYLVEQGWRMEIPIVLDAKGGNSFHLRQAGRKKWKTEAGGRGNHQSSVYCLVGKKLKAAHIYIHLVIDCNGTLK